jgi:hypothetical protein
MEKERVTACAYAAGMLVLRTIVGGRRPRECETPSHVRSTQVCDRQHQTRHTVCIHLAALCSLVASGTRARGSHHFVADHDGMPLALNHIPQRP